MGLPLAARLAEAGLDVRASTTTPEKRDAIRAVGARPHVLYARPHGLEGEDAAAFLKTDLLVLTLPPSGTDDYAATVGAVADAAVACGTRWAVLTSSTSVYPDLGRVVTEEDAGARPGLPLARSGAAVLAAEEALRARAPLGATVVRLAGLYGYGRHPARYLAGRTDLPDGDAPVNLVHRDDAIEAMLAVLRAGAREAVFNVCAPEHPCRRDYYTAMARMLGLDPPTFLPGGRGKRVSSARLEALDFRFRYPDPRTPAP